MGKNYFSQRWAFMFGTRVQTAARSQAPPVGMPGPPLRLTSREQGRRRGARTGPELFPPPLGATGHRAVRTQRGELSSNPSHRDTNLL